MNQFDGIADQFDWPKAWKIVPSGNIVTRFEDDSRFGQLQVGFTCDGDAWVGVLQDPDNRAVGGNMLRFRGFSGGGQSLRVRTALMVLALAIEADNKERLQDRA
jgi:hypothetical protein